MKVELVLKPWPKNPQVCPACGRGGDKHKLGVHGSAVRVAYKRKTWLTPEHMEFDCNKRYGCGFVWWTGLKCNLK